MAVAMPYQHRPNPNIGAMTQGTCLDDARRVLQLLDDEQCSAWLAQHFHPPG